MSLCKNLPDLPADFWFEVASTTDSFEVWNKLVTLVPAVSRHGSYRYILEKKKSAPAKTNLIFPKNEPHHFVIRTLAGNLHTGDPRYPAYEKVMPPTSRIEYLRAKHGHPCHFKDGPTVFASDVGRGYTLHLENDDFISRGPYPVAELVTYDAPGFPPETRYSRILIYKAADQNMKIVLQLFPGSRDVDVNFVHERYVLQDYAAMLEGRLNYRMYLAETRGPDLYCNGRRVDEMIKTPVESLARVIDQHCRPSDLMAGVLVPAIDNFYLQIYSAFTGH